MADRVSFSDILETESSRLSDSVFDENPNIKSFEDFDSAFRSKFNTPRGGNAKITSDDVIKLFNTSEVKKRIKGNVDNKQFEEIYGDGIAVERVAISPKKVRTVRFKKIKITTHQRSGRRVKSYSKGYTKWSNAQERFLKQRSNLKPKQVVQEYNAHFFRTPRTESSVKTKFNRLRK